MTLTRIMPLVAPTASLKHHRNFVNRVLYSSSLKMSGSGFVQKDRPRPVSVATSYQTEGTRSAPSGPGWLPRRLLLVSRFFSTLSACDLFLYRLHVRYLVPLR